MRIHWGLRTAVSLPRDIGHRHHVEAIQAIIQLIS